MIKRIELKNFMSHKHTVIDLADGLTVLIGPNNVGKSAIIVALQTLCYNDNSTFVVRHGEKSCSVVVETDDGHVVEWHRKTSPGYIIDGQKFDRLGRGRFPEELHQALRLPKVQGSGDEQFDVHFGDQKSPIFLLDSTGSQAARFFASSSDASKLVEMEKLHRQNVLKANADRKRLEAESTRVNAELAALDPVSQIEKEVEQLEASYRAIDSLVSRLHSLSETEHGLTAQLWQVEWSTAEFASLNALNAPPALHDTLSLERRIVECLQTQEALLYAQSVMTAASELPAVPILAETKSLETLVRQILETTSQQQVGASVTHTLAGLRDAPVLSSTASLERDTCELISRQLAVEHASKEVESTRSLVMLEQAETSGLERLLSELDEASRMVSLYRCEFDSLGAFDEIPVTASTAELHALLSAWEEANQNMVKQESVLAMIEEDLASVVAEMEKFARSASCPVCGGEMNVDKLIQQAECGGHFNG